MDESVPIGFFSAGPIGVRPARGETRACPDCGRPQHYTGHENGWAHDAAFATLTCGASPEFIEMVTK